LTALRQEKELTVLPVVSNYVLVTKVGFGGGSEAANALVPPAVAAALFDATGVHARRLPLTTAYVSSMLRV